MARKSFLDRVQPNRMRSKLVTWPFPVEEGEPPKVRVKVLGAHELEAAHLATADYFRAKKKPVKTTDGAFVAREHIELVWRAFSDEDGQPLADTAAEMSTQPAEVFSELYAEWSAFQAEVAARPLNQEQLDELVDGLKKNILPEALSAWPSIWLQQVITTLVAQSANSTPANEHG